MGQLYQELNLQTIAMKAKGLFEEKLEIALDAFLI